MLQFFGEDFSRFYSGPKIGNIVGRLLQGICSKATTSCCVLSCLRPLAMQVGSAALGPRWIYAYQSLTGPKLCRLLHWAEARRMHMP
ncbi:hypothetical protein VNO77_07468 [Canavalia gladiata]|uniref:Uncharacterized protein n=1 Tax=Canavalia gladiata TaxID=3824 RepID=A0AAN9QW63_CANGL